jgi:uncharacterized protein with HEPN domain
VSDRPATLLVQDMLHAASKIEGYVDGFDRDMFIADSKTSDAVVRNLEIIGEAAARVPEEVRKINPDIQWRAIIGLRNRVVHAYFGVDLDLVWSIITNDLKRLSQSLLELQARLDGAP